MNTIRVTMTETVTYFKDYTVEQLEALTGANDEDMLHLFNEYADEADLSDVLDDIIKNPGELEVTNREWLATEV